MIRVAVILPAAGSSTRFGPGEKKPFVALDGSPIFARSAQLFTARPDVSRIYLVVSPADQAEVQTRFGLLLKELNLDLVAGGSERFESVANALARIPEGVDHVAIHDAVRPLLTSRLIDNVFAAASTNGAALLALPVTDTLKRVDRSGTIVATVDRANLWRAQTPQVFRRDWLLEAYHRRHTIGSAVTDDAQLVEALGYSVMVVPGSAENFKITTREDLVLAEAVLRGRAASGGL